jgi:hypothetical protein
VDRTTIRPVLALTMLAVATAVVLPARAADVVVVDEGGISVAWVPWLEENAPAAVICWASWAPGATDVVKELDAMKGLAEARGLELVLVSVQETADEARAGLSEISVRWLHDRYGRVLKYHRVIMIPGLVIVDADGEVIGRMEASAEALRGWPGR